MIINYIDSKIVKELNGYLLQKLIKYSSLSFFEFFSMSHELNLIVVVIEKPTKMEFVSLNWLILQSVSLFSPLFLEQYFLLFRLVTNQNYIVCVVTESVHHVIF